MKPNNSMKPEEAITFFRQCAIDIANSSSPAQRMALKEYGERAEATIRQALDQPPPAAADDPTIDQPRPSTRRPDREK